RHGSFLRKSAQRFVDARHSFFQKLLCDFFDNRRVSAHRSDLSNSRAHQPATQHADSLNSHYRASTIIAMPCPPPIHADARPYFFFLRLSSYNTVITRRVPVAPNG